MKTIKSKFDISYKLWLELEEPLKDPNQTVEALSKLYDINVKLLTPKQITALYSNLADVMKQEPTLIRKFTIKNVEYGFIPDFYKIKTNELIDMDFCLEQNDLLTLASILYRPIDSKNGDFYTIKKYDGEPDDNLLNEISVGVIEGFMSFFSKSFQTLSEISPTYLSSMK